MLTEQELEMLRSLRERGYAVVLFSPEELGDTEPDQVEDYLIERGWDAIDMKSQRKKEKE